MRETSKRESTLDQFSVRCLIRICISALRKQSDCRGYRMGVCSSVSDVFVSKTGRISCVLGMCWNIGVPTSSMMEHTFIFVKI